MPTPRVPAAVLSLAAWIAVNGIYAADAPSTAEQPFAELRGQLSALSAANAPVATGVTGAVPVYTVPSIQYATEATASDQPRSSTAKQRQTQKSSVSSHWLLDAMNQSSQNSASSVRARGADYPFNAKHTDGATTDKDALTLEADLTENTESKASPFLNPSRREAAADNQNRGEPQLNPFAGFLRDWLSPQDLAMLSSSAQATATGLGFASGDGPFSPAGAVLENVSLSPRVPLMDTSFAGGVPPPARPNPFLETLVLPANSIPEIPAPFLSARTETPMAAAPSSMPILPSQASTSLDSAPARPFVPPPLEDNHFPQLRRF